MTIHDSKITKLLLRLSEAARADRRSNLKYIDYGENRSKVALERHVVIFGRRGSGKTSLLNEVGKNGKQAGEVVWIDADQYKKLTFPDTLIEIFRQSILEFNHLIRKRFPYYNPLTIGRWPSRWSTLRGFKRFQQVFTELLEEFDSADVTREQESQAFGSGSAGVAGKGASVQLSKGTSARLTEKSSGATLKIQSIDRKFQDFRNAMVTGLNLLSTPVFFVLDDFYHLKIDDQAKVLDYLARLFKNTRCYIKFATISHRTCLYKSGATIDGLQLGHDVHDVNLDRSLKNFNAVDKFLIDFWVSLCKTVEIKQDFLSIFGGDSWRQLELASGGVPRDFMNTFVKAVEAGRSKGKDKLSVALINEGANLYCRETKYEDLRKDSSDETSVLEALLKDLVDFCVEVKKRNLFLISTKDLENHSALDEAMKQLCDFRFLHEVHENMSSASRPGERFRAYLLDVGVYAYPARRGVNKVVEIPFWESDDKRRSDALRISPIYALKDNYAPATSPEELFASRDDSALDTATSTTSQPSDPDRRVDSQGNLFDG